MTTGTTPGMSATSIHVTLPKALKEHIEKRVAEGESTSPSDYVHSLVRASRYFDVSIEFVPVGSIPEAATRINSGYCDVLMS